MEHIRTIRIDRISTEEAQGSATGDRPRRVPSPPRLAQVIAAAYDTYQQTMDAALRELLSEVVIAMGIDQDFRTEISQEDAMQVLEALRYVQEARP